MSDEISKFLVGVVGVVEATSFEQHMLWVTHEKEYHWVSDNLGYIPTIGRLDNRPITMSLFKAAVDGKILLFWYAPSAVVDYTMIEKWLEDHLPMTAFRGGDPRKGVNRTDPMNFCNILSAVGAKPKEAHKQTPSLHALVAARMVAAG